MPKKSQPSLKKPLKTKNIVKTIRGAIARDSLVSYLGELLQVNQVKDYCPNGLQVQGKASIKKIVTGVTASKALIEEAINQKADAILVHHGWFWKNGYNSKALNNANHGPRSIYPSYHNHRPLPPGLLQLLSLLEH